MGDVMRLVSGTGIAQIVMLCSAPILTRLYAPQLFGMAAMFTSFTGILCVIACMRYELAIVLPDEDEDAANLLALSLGFTILMALLTVPLSIFAGPTILGWVRMPSLAPYMWLVPVVVLINGVFNSLNYWNTRTKHFTRLSISRVAGSLSATSGTVGAALGGYATGGAMIGAQAAGQGIATTVLGAQIWRDDHQFILSHLSCARMLRALKRYRKFALIDSWAGLLNMLSLQLPVLLLGAFFSPVIVGLYAFGNRLLSLPMGLLGTAIGQAFFQRASVAKTGGGLAELVSKTIQQLFLIGFYPFMLLVLISPHLFVLLFGKEWQTAGVYVQILAPWLLFQFIYSPISCLYWIFDKQEINVLFNVILTATRFLSLLTGGLMHNIELALALFTASGILVYSIFGVYLMNLSGVNAGILSWEISKKMRLAVLFLVPVFFVNFFSGSAMLPGLSAAAVSATGFGSCLAYQSGKLAKLRKLIFR